jgi:hypothetical protein
MFESLSEQIRHDEQLQVSNNERLVRWIVVAIVSLVVFGGLYFAIQLLG